MLVSIRSLMEQNVFSFLVVRRLCFSLACLLLLKSGPLIADDRVSPATKALHALFESEWEKKLRDEPTLSSYLGYKQHNSRWPDRSLSFLRNQHEHRQAVLGRLDQIDLDQLSSSDRINYELFRQQYENDVRSFPFGWHLIPLNQREGIQDESSLADAMSFDTVRDYEDWISRLNRFPTYMDQTLALMQEGVRRRIVHARVVMNRLPAQIRRQIVDDPTASLYYKPFRRFPDDIPAAEQQRLRTDAAAAIRRNIIPSYRKMLEFFEAVYLPACYEKVGVFQFPDGQKFYAHRAKLFTTTDLTPQEIHDIGHREVKRIRAEMEAIVKQVEFKGSFREFLEHLRTDPKFYFENPNDLLVAYRDACKKIDPQLVRLFGKLPRIPYGIEPIPEHIAPDTTTAYYREPSADGLRAGTYFVNLYKPEVRPKYEIEVLSVHEAVPGHHLQLALALELENVPTFRRFAGYTAFIEGWALYSEGLGEQLGLYQDPYSKFGQLTYDMWRAVRLVVDTGMHSRGWTRQQAIDFFAENTAKTMLDIENEVDRYIAWPGQALAYKIGQLKIQELRAKAEHKLGDRFDIRAFHDMLLSEGSVTLSIVERMVDDWIAEQKGGA